jgi:hypothetical protein
MYTDISLFTFTEGLLHPFIRNWVSISLWVLLKETYVHVTFRNDDYTVIETVVREGKNSYFWPNLLKVRDIGHLWLQLKM